MTTRRSFPRVRRPQRKTVNVSSLQPKLRTHGTTVPLLHSLSWRSAYGQVQTCVHILQFSKRDKLPTNVHCEVELSKFVVTGLIWNDSEVIVQIPVLGLHVKKRSCASRRNSRPTHPPIQWKLVPICREVKRPENGTDHSLPSSAQVKNEWSYTSTPPHYFTACTQTTLTLPQVQARCY